MEKAFDTHTPTNAHTCTWGHDSYPPGAKQLQLNRAFNFASQGVLQSHNLAWGNQITCNVGSKETF